MGDTTESTSAAPQPIDGQGSLGRADDFIVGRTLDGRYRIERRVARGGMATVYAATDLRLERVVALKVMHPSFAEDPDFVGRFVREARSAARLSDPHIVAVFDQGETLDGVAYLVMEYVDGRTLRDVLQQHGPCTAGQALTIIESVAEALAAAHRGGIVHRDIKPENVLIDDRGRIKVADFGLARAVTSATSHVATQGLLIGTVAYLSPEQVEEGIATARSDVYGAGVLMYEILTGEVPFTGETPLAVAYKHVNSDVPPPSLVDSRIPPAVDQLVLQMTARDPQRRFADGAALLDAVRVARRSVPLTANDSAATVIVERPVAAAAAGVAAAAVIAGAAQPAAATGGSATSTSPTQSTAVLPVQQAAAAIPVAQPAAGGEDPPPPAQTKKRRRRWPWVLGIVLLLGLIAGGAYAVWLQTQQVNVPNVVNLTPNQASSVLSREGLQLSIAGELFSETIRAGHIVRSNPLTGATATKGQRVFVMISKGPERHAVPDVSGMTPTAASAALKSNRLAVGVTTSAYNDSITKGLVVKTNPPKGQLLRRGTSVDLIISKGPQPVPAPNVVGRTQTAAAARLAAAGLGIGSVTKQYSDTVALGAVISQNPTPGTIVDHGSTVDLVVSKGPPPVTVPGVRDMSVNAAIAELHKVGLKVKLQYPLGMSLLGRVLSQTPAAGTVVPKGTLITLKIV